MPVVQPQIIQRPRDPKRDPFQTLINALQAGVNVFGAIEAAKRNRALTDQLNQELYSDQLAVMESDVAEERTLQAVRGKVQEGFVERPPSEEQFAEMGKQDYSNVGGFGAIGKFAEIARRATPYLPWELDDPRLAFSALVAEQLLSRSDIADVGKVAGAPVPLESIPAGPRRETARRLMAEVRGLKPEDIGDNVLISDTKYPELLDARMVQTMMLNPEVREAVIAMKGGEYMKLGPGVPMAEGLSRAMLSNKVWKEMMDLAASETGLFGKAVNRIVWRSFGEDGPLLELQFDGAAIKDYEIAHDVSFPMTPEQRKAVDNRQSFQHVVSETAITDMYATFMRPFQYIDTQADWMAANRKANADLVQWYVETFPGTPEHMAQILVNVGTVPLARHLDPRFPIEKEVYLSDEEEAYFQTQVIPRVATYRSSLDAARAHAIVANSPLKARLENLFGILDMMANLSDKIDSGDYNDMVRALKSWEDMEMWKQLLPDIGWGNLEDSDIGFLSNMYMWYHDGGREFKLPDGTTKWVPWDAFTPEMQEQFLEQLGMTQGAAARTSKALEGTDFPSSSLAIIRDLYNSSRNDSERMLAYNTFKEYLSIPPHNMGDQDFVDNIGPLPKGVTPDITIEAQALRYNIATKTQELAAKRQLRAALSGSQMESGEAMYTSRTKSAERVADLDKEIAELQNQIAQLEMQINSLTLPTPADSVRIDTSKDAGAVRE